MRYFPVLCWRTFLGKSWEEQRRVRANSRSDVTPRWKKDVSTNGKCSAPVGKRKCDGEEKDERPPIQGSSFFSTHMINTTRATSFASGDHKCVWKWEINVKFPPQSSPTTRILTFLEKQVQGGHQSKLWDCKLMNRHFSPHTPSIFPRLTCNLVFLLLTFLGTF